MVLYGPQYGTSPSLTISCNGEKSCYAAYIDCKYCHTTTITCYGSFTCGYQTVFYGDIDYITRGYIYGYLHCTGGDSVCRYSHYMGNGLKEMQEL